MQATAIQNIPNLQTQQMQSNINSIHYGYTAFRDISLRDTLGIAHRVQPPHSPYYSFLPGKQLIPFVTIQVPNEPDAESPHLIKTSVKGYLRPSSAQKNANGDILDPTVIFSTKVAYECITEIADVYAEVGFTILTPLTGMNEVDAFDIFQTIQPFTFRLKDMLKAFDEAVDRINAVAPYTVVYEDLAVDLEPLRADLKDAAFKTLDLMRASAELSANRSRAIVNRTTQKLTQFYATGTGKEQADPLDKFVFGELGEEIPQLVSNTKTTDEGVLSKLAELLSVRNAPSDIEARLIEKERLLDERMAQLEALINPKESVSVGQTVTVAGEEATVTAKPFGKVKVKFADGSERTVEKSEIE